MGTPQSEPRSDFCGHVLVVVTLSGYLNISLEIVQFLRQT
jgi:hypothetical protein